MFVRLFKHFGLWSPNRWADRDGQIFVRCAGATERQLCQLWADRLHLVGVTCICNIAKSCKKYVINASGQTKGRIRLKHGGPIATVEDVIHWGCRRWRPLHTCERHVTGNFSLLHFAPERLVQLGRERHRLTRTDDGKIALSIIEGSWVRIPPGAHLGR